MLFPPPPLSLSRFCWRDSGDRNHRSFLFISYFYSLFHSRIVPSTRGKNGILLIKNFRQKHPILFIAYKQFFFFYTFPNKIHHPTFSLKFILPLTADEIRRINQSVCVCVGLGKSQRCFCPNVNYWEMNFYENSKLIAKSKFDYSEDACRKFLRFISTARVPPSRPPSLQD